MDPLVCMYVCICICMYVYVCMYVYIYIYIHHRMMLIAIWAPLSDFFPLKLSVTRWLPFWLAASSVVQASSSASSESASESASSPFCPSSSLSACRSIFVPSIR